jgi:hypothetical protein
MLKGINKFKKSYEGRSNLIMGEKGDQLADYHSKLKVWINSFSQLLNLHRLSDVRQI